MQIPVESGPPPLLDPRMVPMNFITPRFTILSTSLHIHDKSTHYVYVCDMITQFRTYLTFYSYQQYLVSIFSKHVMLNIQWKKNVDLRILCLELGKHHQWTSLRIFLFLNCSYIWGIYHFFNYWGVVQSRKKHIISEELGYYSNETDIDAIT